MERLSPLASPSATRAVLEAHGLSTKYSLGQNFLVNDAILRKIVALAELSPEDEVLEIGPGIGTLTVALLKCAGRVASVERDADLPAVLAETLAPWADRFTLVEKDALDLAAADLPFSPTKLVANLPYAVAATVVLDCFERFSGLESATVMVQKEVADRMQVGPGSKDYGALSLAVQYYASPYIVANVPPNCFIPRPNVGSAVIRLTRYKEPPVQVTDPALMFRLIRASFNQRRKTLQNGLNNSPELSYTKEDIAEAIAGLGLPASVRGEALTLEQFAALANYFTEHF